MAAERNILLTIPEQSNHSYQLKVDMPFTPVHLGPGILIKAILQSSFSLMVFGWTQVLMDIQPLMVIITGQGHLHGFSHTFVGATLIAIIATLSGKYLAEFGLNLLKINQGNNAIKWWVALISALIGSFSHVILDGIMHTDVQPYYPFNQSNEFWGLISIANLHQLCLYSGLIGAAIFIGLHWWRSQ